MYGDLTCATRNASLKDRHDERKEGMIRRYIDRALDRARYTQLEDGAYCAEVRGLRGVIATGPTLEKCRTALERVNSMMCLKFERSRGAIGSMDSRSSRGTGSRSPSRRTAAPGRARRTSSSRIRFPSRPLAGVRLAFGGSGSRAWVAPALGRAWWTGPSFPSGRGSRRQVAEAARRRPYGRQIEPSNVDRPAALTKLPTARITPVAPARSSDPPTMVCTSSSSPSPAV